MGTEKTNHASITPITTTDLSAYFSKIAQGKVRDIYAIDHDILLFVATDRVSAYDVVLKNGIPNKGALLTLLSRFWFSLLPTLIPSLKTHFLTLDLPSSLQNSDLAPSFHNRSMQVRRYKKLFAIESIVRGYITGSAWSEYKKTGTVHGIAMPTGLQESAKLEKPLWTPSTKAEQGLHDENISPEKAAEIVGAEYAKRIEELSLEIYCKARDYAAERGIIIADTKFEFALDTSASNPADAVILVDEVLTPDSSRFWPAAKYQVGKTQESLDKQFLRDWLTKEGLKGKEGVEMPEEVAKRTADGYREAFEKLAGKSFEAALTE
ncbi:MAG: Bifunctional purine biosynthetic protein ade1 [Cirrosporium novae-zelandiae]|nr:MAG: Bifunctional purine biosynthetic protein ade1 [Cirrosporium novae-zelandiae]